jgi:hypothetical protein
VDLDPSLNVPDSTGWTPVGLGDFNQDGQADILWHHVGGTTGAWLMDWRANQATVSGFVNLSSSLNVPDSSGWRVVGTNDFNQDGDTDILWHNGQSGETQVWYMGFRFIRSGLSFVPDIYRKNYANVSGSINAPESSGWQIAGTADLNGDNVADILWHNGTTGASRIQTVAWSAGAAETGVVDFAADCGDPFGPTQSNCGNLPDSSAWRFVEAVNFHRQDGSPDILLRKLTTFDSALNVPDSTGWRIVPR